VSVAGLLLAAGGGRRLGGRPKALLAHGGRLLVERGARLLTTAGLDPVVVVVGAAAEEVLARAALGSARTVVNPGWAEGIGSSLRVGLAALEQAGNIEAVVVALVDQPHLRGEVIGRLVAAWRAGARAAVATFAGQPRNPVLLDRSVWDDVREQAVGDVGARGYLRRHPELVAGVPCDDVGSPFDVDTEADLARLAEAESEPEGASWN
jgi:CTP:molybdopterin cytidylyltransferase MocA